MTIIIGAKCSDQARRAVILSSWSALLPVCLCSVFKVNKDVGGMLSCSCLYSNIFCLALWQILKRQVHTILQIVYAVVCQIAHWVDRGVSTKLMQSGTRLCFLSEGELCERDSECQHGTVLEKSIMLHNVVMGWVVVGGIDAVFATNTLTVNVVHNLID